MKWFEQILNIREATELPHLMKSGSLPALISGLSPVHRVMLAAALWEKTERPLVAICPDETSAITFAGDIASMTGANVNLLLARDFILIPAAGVSGSNALNRLNCLYEIATAEDKKQIIVASAAGLIQRSVPKETLLASAVNIDIYSQADPEELCRRLVRCGYKSAVQVDGAGQFSLRGGILDFFSPLEPYPVRIEFWGDDIDSMSYFDPDSQRRIENIEKVTILPATEAAAVYGEYCACEDNPPFAEGLRLFGAKYIKRRSSETAIKLNETLNLDADRFSNDIPTDADKYLPLMGAFACGLEYIPGDAIVFLDRPKFVAEQAKAWIKQLTADIEEQIRKGNMIPSSADNNSFFLPLNSFLNIIREYPLYMADAFVLGNPPIPPKHLTSISAKQLPAFAGSMSAMADDIKSYLKLSYSVLLLAGDQRRRELLSSFLEESGIKTAAYDETELFGSGGDGVVRMAVGSVSSGMEFPTLKTAVLSDSRLVNKTKKRRISKNLPPNRQRLESYSDLSVGDFVVHESYGIGKFLGTATMKHDGIEKEYIKIAYAGTETLYVPVTSLDLVTKYIGGSENSEVRLSRLGTAEWSKTRARAKKSAKDMADKLIKLYAERKRLPGYAFSPDTPWQREFEANFSYTETDDQLRCIAEIKSDMEQSAPMDRLLCGDVGFGKTEVALRAVMKCILDGKQAAILAPTTVLVRQHYQTAQQRFFGFPVNIGQISRFSTSKQMSKTLLDVSDGTCDLVIGTHRLLSKDIKFKNLGLLVVDEEQRFGVGHKEHIKEMSKGVDVITLSATPIPRTLNMAMAGIRDMSVIEEPPEDRQPVQTFVMEHDWSVVCDAINRELSRGGQVYYMHNRVEDIERTAIKLGKLLNGDDWNPSDEEGATIGIVHGKMDKELLGETMEDMVNGKIRVLVCTTIIETGIDIPNVNTLIIEDADKLGLAQLHQIRGRVGRSSRRASAYFMFKKDKVLTEVAEKRLNAIRDFAQFGSGLKIAMRDLEIRGAGNLLGAEQSGHMTDVGYDMYMKLLSEAVLEAKGEPVDRRAECAADLAVSANIPDKYVPSPEQRMDLYRRIAAIRSEEQAEDLLDEIIDRFGEPPPGVSALVAVSLLRAKAGKAGITDISQKKGELRFTFTEFEPEKVFRLHAEERYRNRIRLDAGSFSPCVCLKIKDKRHVIEEAEHFISDLDLSSENG